MKVPLAGRHQLPLQPQPPSQQQGLSDNPFAHITPPQQPARQQPVSPPPPQPPPTKPVNTLPFRKFLPLIGALIIGILVLFFAGKMIGGLFSAKSNGPVKLTYWGLWEEESVINTIINDFERQNPHISIVYEKQNIKQYRDILTARIDQGKGPDIFRFHNTWVPELTGYLSPVPNSVYSSQDFQKIFYPVVSDTVKVGNNYYGIPLSIDTLCLFINQDIFQSAGELPPIDWNDLVKKARQLTVVDPQTRRIQTSGAALGTATNVDHASDIVALMMMQNGADFTNLTKQSKDGRNLAADVLTFYTQFAQGDKKTWDDTLDPSTLAFAKGKVAMYFGYSWDIFTIKSLNPQLRFKIVTPPQITGSKIAFASYWVEGVSSKSTHQKEAFQFLQYLSRSEVMQKLFTEQSKLRLFGEPYSRIDLASQGKTNQYLSPFLELAPYAKSWYLASNTYDNGLDDGMIKYFSDGITSITKNSVSPESALVTIQDGVKQKLTQYGIK